MALLPMCPLGTLNYQLYIWTRMSLPKMVRESAQYSLQLLPTLSVVVISKTGRYFGYLVVDVVFIWHNTINHSVILMEFQYRIQYCTWSKGKVVSIVDTLVYMAEESHPSVLEEGTATNHLRVYAQTHFIAKTTGSSGERQIFYQGFICSKPAI